MRNIFSQLNLKKELSIKINTFLHTYLNLRIQRTKVIRFPNEATDRDKEIMSSMLKPDGDRNKMLSKISDDRLFAAISAVKYLERNKIDGDLVECGVWKGGCAAAMAMVLKDIGSEKKIYLYDTYEGMTEPSEFDNIYTSGENAMKRFLSHKEKGDKWCYSSINEVKSLFQKYDLLDFSIFIKGDVAQTLNVEDNLPKKISLLRLDTDFYDSTLKELETLYPRLEKGGVLLIDDYGFWDGAKKAVDEYFSQSDFPMPLMWINDFSGRGMIKI